MAFGVSLPAIATVLAFPAYIYIALILPQYRHPALYIATAILTAGSAWSLVYAWKRKRLLTASILFCCGFLLTAFAGGFSLPKFNSLIGYTELAEKAQQQEKVWQTTGVVTYGVWRAENMDVFFPERLTVVHEADSLITKQQNRLLILNKSKLQENVVDSLVATKPKVEALGDYLFVKF